MSDNNINNTNNNDDNVGGDFAVFADEQAMLTQLEVMGMPREMLRNLTEEQKKAMFAMTRSADVQARARERVSEEEDWQTVVAPSSPYEWKNTRDDVFVRVHGVTDRVTCDVQPNHLTITDGDDDGIIMDRQLFQTVNVKESSWQIQGGTLAVCLRKAQVPMRWLALHR